MKGRVFLIHWDGEECSQYKSSLEKLGLLVEAESEDGSKAFTRIRELAPDAVIIYLTRFPSHGRAVMEAMQNNGRTSFIPVFLVEKKERKGTTVLTGQENVWIVKENGLVPALTAFIKGI